MIIEGTEKILVNASISLKKTILEIKKLTCECNTNNECFKCRLLKELIKQKSYIDTEIDKRCL